MDNQKREKELKMISEMLMLLYKSRKLNLKSLKDTEERILWWINRYDKLNSNRGLFGLVLEPQDTKLFNEQMRNKIASERLLPQLKHKSDKK